MIAKLLWLPLLFVAVTVSFAQSPRPDSLPRSFTYFSSIKPLTVGSAIETVILPPQNVDSVERLEQALDSQGVLRPYRFGILIPMQLTLKTHGTLNEIEGGAYLWRMKFVCPGAKSINFIFTQTSLPQGSFLYAYNNAKTSLEGPWHYRNARAGKQLCVFPVQGDTAIIEVLISENNLSSTDFELSDVVYGFRRNVTSVNRSLLARGLPTEINSDHISLPCNVDVNCTEGNNWCREKFSVTRILIGGLAWCTGSLLNNARQDFTPYLLTAFHCLDYFGGENGELSEDEINQVQAWTFQFGYMLEDCNGDDDDPYFIVPTFTYSGAIFRAGRSRFQANNGTDFALLELVQQPLSGDGWDFEDVYFNGWDRTGDTPANTVGLHHPKGDFMKIVIDQQSPSITGDLVNTPCEGADQAGNEFWRTRPDIGTVQPVSSGSPLFNPEHRVIGQLLGGCNCLSSLNNAIYGRFSLSWVGDGINDNTRLSNWLDPDGTGAQTLNGLKPDNHQGGVFATGSTGKLNAYRNLTVGSIDKGTYTQGFKVLSGATYNIKAGREIRLLPCTHLESGSKVRVHIEELSCNDPVLVSWMETDISPNCGLSWSANGGSDNPAKEAVSPPVMVSNLPLSVYPTPAGDAVTIGYNIPGNAALNELYVIDPLGNRIAALPVGAGSGHKGSVDFNSSHLPAGMYRVVLRASGSAVSAPLVIVR